MRALILRSDIFFYKNTSQIFTGLSVHFNGSSKIWDGPILNVYSHFLRMSHLLCTKTLPWLTDDVISQLFENNVNTTADFLRTKTTILESFCQLSMYEIDQTKVYFNSAIENEIISGMALINLTRGKSNTIKTHIKSFDKLLCGGLRLGQTLLVSHQYPQRNEIDQLIKKLCLWVLN